LDEARHANGHGDGPGAEVRGQRQHARASRGEDARPQRHRRRRDRYRPRDRLRALRRGRLKPQQGARRLHPHRQADHRCAAARTCTGRRSTSPARSTPT
jgi:hypothetical protein